MVDMNKAFAYSTVGGAEAKETLNNSSIGG